ncbi:MAG: hypothetical protein FWF50_05355 [Defluviitaleaceae bacterium]|nr:hypothetical protein [Defluviitaleaceae bacterium]
MTNNQFKAFVKQVNSRIDLALEKKDSDPQKALEEIEKIREDLQIALED